VTSLPYSAIGASPFAIEFAQDSPRVMPFFNNAANRAALADVRCRQGASRSRLVDLARQSMGLLPLSSAIEENLQALSSTKSVVAITGQQVGFMGGPLYTVLKIASTVAAAQELSHGLGRAVVPMFWLEDNDHDAAEAGTAALPDASGTAVEARLWNGDAARLAVHRRTITGEDVQRVHQATGVLYGQEAQAAAQRVHSAYAEGSTWSDAMMAMLHPYLQHWGVIAVRGSHVISSGMHAPIVMAECNHPGRMAALVAERNTLLEGRGYKPQASVGHYSFFVEVNGLRHRPVAEGNAVRVGQETWTLDALQNFVATHPHLCSPGVLLRPIIQDALFPTIVNIVGGAEAAYHAQIGECYSAAGVAQPLTWMRHSATIVDHRTERLMTKSGLTVQDVIRPMANIERDIIAATSANVIPDVSQSPLSVAWREAAISIDPTLGGAVAAAEAAIGKALEQLAGKMRSALKRKSGEALDRVRTVAGTIYPLETLQERVTPMAWFEARLGIDTFRKIAEAITAKPRASHQVMYVADVDSVTESNNNRTT